MKLSYLKSNHRWVFISRTLHCLFFNSIIQNNNLTTEYTEETGDTKTTSTNRPNLTMRDPLLGWAPRCPLDEDHVTRRVNNRRRPKRLPIYRITLPGDILRIKNVWVGCRLMMSCRMPIQHCHWIVPPRWPLAEQVSWVAYLTPSNYRQCFAEDYEITDNWYNTGATIQ